MQMANQQISYIVWKNYQRRAEVISLQLEARLEFMPHLFRQKYLRWVDYLLKIIATLTHIVQYKPDLVIFQSPPLFPAIPILLLGVPYVVDAHNATIQSFWARLPLSHFILRRARATVVHNDEVLKLARNKFPDVKFVSILDPIEPISSFSEQRISNQILLICSFGRDEPIDIIIECIRRSPNYCFVITADIKKLSSSQQEKLSRCSNVRLTGFLSTSAYHQTLCSSLAALVLTTRSATQPSGACEALASDTQLILSKTSLTKKLFGEWAVLVENTVEAIVSAIQSLEYIPIDLSKYRSQWNTNVAGQIQLLQHYTRNPENTDSLGALQEISDRAKD